MYKFPAPHWIIFIAIELGKGKEEGRKLREGILISSLRYRSRTTMSPAESHYSPPLVSHIPQNAASHMALTTAFAFQQPVVSLRKLLPLPSKSTLQYAVWDAASLSGATALLCRLLPLGCPRE